MMDRDTGLSGPEVELLRNMNNSAQSHDRGVDALLSSDLKEQMARLRQTVEKDHDNRLQRIETDLRWIMTLVSAQLVALIGGAIATFTIN